MEVKSTTVALNQVLHDTMTEVLRINITGNSYAVHDGSSILELFPEDLNTMPPEETFLWSLLFVPLVILSNLTNFIVIWIILSQKSMRKVTNYFIVNLSVSDILLTTLNVPTGFYYLTQGNWPFGELYCKFYNFIVVASMSASVLTLVAISFDR